LIRSRREKRTAEAGLRFRQATEGWRAAVADCEAGDLTRKADHVKAVALVEAEDRRAKEAWAKRRDLHLAAQQSRNDAVDRRHAAYTQTIPDAVVEYCDMVLSASSAMSRCVLNLGE
jgi:restriction system protein